MSEFKSSAMWMYDVFFVCMLSNVLNLTEESQPPNVLHVHVYREYPTNSEIFTVTGILKLWNIAVNNKFLLCKCLFSQVWSTQRYTMQTALSF